MSSVGEALGEKQRDLVSQINQVGLSGRKKAMVTQGINQQATEPTEYIIKDKVMFAS